MKKRLFALATAIIILASCVLTGCTTIDENLTDADLVDTSGYACIKVYGVKNPTTTDEAVAQVEEVINNITLKEFKTKVKLMLYAEDEYLQAIDEALNGLDELAAQQKKEKADARAESKRLTKLKSEDYEAYRKEMVAKQTEAKKKAEEKADEEKRLQAEAEAAGVEYIPEIEIPEHAIDVLLVRDVAELNDFKEKSLLKSLSEYIGLDYKSISKYLHPTLINSGKVGTTVYGIVNNTYDSGDSQFAVFDTELYEKYKGEIADMKNLGSFRAFLEEVQLNEEGVIPLLNLPEYIPDGDYLIGENNPIGVYNPDSSTDNTYTISNLFSSTTYQAYFSYIQTYRKAGFLPADGETDSEKWALKFVTGDEYDKKELEEQGYTVFTFTKPRITSDNCHLSFYGVYSDSLYPTRAMQFIEMLTTNKELQTAFAYGVEGVNYELTEDGRVHRLNDTYSIDLSYVGNRYIGYPTEDEPVDVFEMAREKVQNIKLSALYGRTFDYSKEYFEGYTVEKVDENIASASNAANGETFGYFVTGDYAADEYSDAYEEELKDYCLSYAVGGGIMMVSPYVEDIDGFYVGSTVRSKLDLPKKLNEVVKANQLPEKLVELMKKASEEGKLKVYSELVQNPENENNSTYYAVYPIMNGDTMTGLTCMTSYIEDTMLSLERILAEYWDDITTGIPNSSIDRFADTLVTAVEEGREKISKAQERVKHAETPEAAESARNAVKSLPDGVTIIKNKILDISDDEAKVNAYASKLNGYVNARISGSMSHDAYVAAVRATVKDDFANMWNVWDEIDSMNQKFSNETNIASLLDILNSQYK